MTSGTNERQVQRICPLCEATCGLVLTLADADDGETSVVSVRGDISDAFSAGYLCPKGIAYGDLHAHGGRVRGPLIRDAGGTLQPATWDEAYAEIRRRYAAIVQAHGAQAVGVYLGNPNVHSAAATVYLPAFVRAMGTRARFSASTVDQMPMQVAAGLVFGTELSIPVPDIDRSDYLLVIGANPMVSNGSLWTAPELPRRLKELRARGGRLVVVDPVRTRTADVADEHVPIRPGTDAFLLAALVREVIALGPDFGRAGQWIDPDVLQRISSVVEPCNPEAVGLATGIPAQTIERIARELVGLRATGSRGAVYSRLGTTTSAYVAPDGLSEPLATVTSWLVLVLNALTGAVDEPGGVMWPTPVAGGPTTWGESGRGRGVRIPGSSRTRVRGLSSALGEWPAASLTEEIVARPAPSDTAGTAQLRGLFVIAGNPVLSVPGGTDLEEALPGLDLLVSVDQFITETSRHAHVVLPAPTPLSKAHHDLVFNHFAVRNTARWTSPSIPPGPNERAEDQVFCELAALAASVVNGVEVRPENVAHLVLKDVVATVLATPDSPAHGVSADEILTATADRDGLERIIDIMIRSARYGDGFGRRPDGLTLATLEASPHGIDLGPLQSRLPEVLRTPSGMIDLAPDVIVQDAARLADLIDEILDAGSTFQGLLMVGRRHLRSNNSWMHQVDRLAGGDRLCTMQIHPSDATRLGLVDGGFAGVQPSHADDRNAVKATVEVTDRVAAGTISLPHGWGHRHAGTWGSDDAPPNRGVSMNHLTPLVVDQLSATAVLAAVPVTVVALP